MFYKLDLAFSLKITVTSFQNGKLSFGSWKIQLYLKEENRMEDKNKNQNEKEEKKKQMYRKKCILHECYYISGHTDYGQFQLI